MLAVNESLESLSLKAPRFLGSDLELLSIGLRQNRTLKRMHLDLVSLGIEMRYVGRGLQPLIETVRYHNTTLEDVSLPITIYQDSLPTQYVLKFHQKVRSACDALRRGEDLERCLPLLGLTHPRTKATLVFCLARLRPEKVAQSLRNWAVVEEDSAVTVGNSEWLWGVLFGVRRQRSWRLSGDFVGYIAHTRTSAAARLRQRDSTPRRSRIRSSIGCLELK